MDLYEAMKSRHSVRRFTDKKIDDVTRGLLQQIVDMCNEESGLSFRLFFDEPKAFGNMFYHYGRFRNCKNYLALVGPQGMDEKYGYYGEKFVLEARRIGLNSCWVGLTYKKSNIPVNLNKGEKVRLVIALGYGVTQGVAHKSEDITELCQSSGEMPDWFKKGMDAALLAPTAINQQKFLMIRNGDTVIAKALPAAYSKVDLGIVKYHFEIGAGKDNFRWGQ